MIVVRLAGSCRATRARRCFKRANFPGLFFLMMLVRDGSPLTAMWRGLRRCTTVSLLPPPRTPKRVSVRLPRLPRDSLRVELWPLVLRPDCFMLAEPLCDFMLVEPFCDAPVLLLAAVPPLDPAFDWPEFCAEDGAASASAATVARVRVKIRICASER